MNEPIMIDGNEKLATAKTALPDLTPKLATMVEEYIGNILPLWKRYNTSTQKTDEASKIITGEKCILPTKGPYSDTRGQPGFDRLAVILNEIVSTIVVYPPVKGDPALFQAILDNIYENKYQEKSDVVILFAPPFYSTSTLDTNKNILANYIHFIMSKETVAKVHILTQSTDANKMIGCQLYSDKDKPNKPLVNMLEPSYVIYPFTRTIDDTMVGSILFSASSENEVNLPASNIRQMSAVSSYFSAGQRGSLAYPPDITTEDHFINKMTPPFVYRFYGPKAETFNNNVLIIKLKGKDQSNAIGKYSIEYNTFVGMDEDYLAIDGVAFESVSLLDMPYSIRKPTPEVRNDWRKYKFTTDEANLLNKLQIRPGMLNEPVFGGDGPGMLVGFLTNLINSKCYTDKELLTKEECSISEDFIDRVYSYLLENDIRIEEGIESRKNKEISAEAEAKRAADAELRIKLSEEETAMYKELLKRLRERFGLDDSVTDESLLKDPYEDGKLIPEEDVSHQEFNLPLQEMDTGQFYMLIVTVDIVGSDTEPSLVIGKLYVDVEKQEDVDTAVDEQILQLAKEYPGWKFFREPENKELGTILEEPDTAVPARAPKPAAPKIARTV